MNEAPKYLVPQCVAREDGIGPSIDLGPLAAKLLTVTIEISDVVEQEGLTFSIWGSADEDYWGPSPLLSFSTKSYCGDYGAFLDLSLQPGIRFLRGQWKMSRWGKRGSEVMFGFLVSIKETRSNVNAAVA